MQTNNETRADGLLQDLASDYSNYLIVDAASEVTKEFLWPNDIVHFSVQWNKLSGSIRNMSANLEEFTALLDSVSSVSAQGQMKQLQ